MFCPQCGSNQNDDLKFCKICGANLQAVRQAITTKETTETTEKFDWNKTWVAEMLRSAEENERIRGITPEVKRYNEIKAGVITSLVGLGVMIFLYVFMQGLILGETMPPKDAEIVGRIWVAGIIPVLVGLGLIINGTYVSKKMIEASKREPITKPVSLERGIEPSALRSGETAEFIPSDASVTEQTTRQLRQTENQ